MPDDAAPKKPHRFAKGASGNPDYQFKKGQSGNPGGRPKDQFGIRELARSYGPEAIDGLRDIARNKKMPPAARVSAWMALLDRGFGKPEQHSIIDLTKHDATDWTRDELVAILHDAAARSNGAAAPDGRNGKSGQVH